MMDDFYSRCLLCTCRPDENPHLQILSKTGNQLQLAMKINKYLNIQIVPELPQGVCRYCVAKLEVTHDLVTRSQEARNTLLQMKQQSENFNTKVKQENSDCTDTDLDYEQPATDSAVINNEKSQNTRTNEYIVDGSNSNCSAESVSSTATKFTEESTQDMTEQSESQLTSEIDIEEHQIKLEPEEDQLECVLRNAGVTNPLKRQLPECQVLIPKLLECDLCSFYTDSKSELETHMQAHQAPNTSDGTLKSLPSNENRNDQLKCGKCGTHFRYPVMLAWHYENCKGTGGRTARSVPNSASLKHSHPFNENHKNNIPTQSDTKAIKCPFCSKDFKSKSAMKNHRASMHRVYKRRKLHLKCEHCVLIFNSYPLLRSHCKSQHPGKHVLKCNECDTEFTSYQGYMRHVKYRHESPRVFTCELCSSTFKLPSNLKAHMNNLHSTVTKPFICNLCDTRFKCETYLRLHIRNVHLGPFLKCDNCDYITRRKLDLKIHYKAKHSSPNKTLSCKICKNKFSCDEFLGRHVREAHTAPILRCDHCKYNTRRPMDLVRHLKAMHLKR